MKGVLIGNLKDHMISQVIPQSRIDRIRQHMELPDVVVGLHNMDQYRDAAHDAEVIWCTWGMETFTAEQVAEYFPNVKALFYCAGSVQDFAHSFLEQGVRVFSAWGANAVPVSEYTLAMILLSTKGVLPAARLSRWNPRASKKISRLQPGAYQSVVGLIGLGMIGRLVAERLKTFDFDVLAFDPFASQEKAGQLGVRLVSIEELFATCDIISSHLADNEQTKDMLTYAHFSKMKSCATFINTARGAQVIEADLVKALREEKNRLAILDVTRIEPPSLLNPLRWQSNAVLTPHIAGSGGNEILRMADWMIEEFELYHSGASCRYEVTLDMLKTMA